jgi:predicted permease
MLTKRPGLSGIAILALALGIGLTTTMFSIVYGAVLQGLPFEDSEELVQVFRTRPSQGARFMGTTIHDFTDWRDQQTSFDDVAAFFAETVNVSGSEGRPIRYLGAYTSAHMFNVLGVQPIMGRTFLPEEDHPSTPPVMILSYRAWQDRFEGNPEILGRVLQANAEPTTVVGVMPEKFGFPQQMDPWLPLRIDPLEFARGSGPALEGTQLNTIARLRDGVSVEEAQAEMSAIAGRLATEYPESNEGIGVEVMPQVDLTVGPEGRALLFVMLGAVFGVLLIACANVANLLLARTVLRSKEVAIRTALGSSRWRTISQLLAETLVLALAGTAVGLFIAKAGIDWFNAVISTLELPLWMVASMDPPVVLFVVGLTVLSTLLAGTVPAFRASSTDLNEVLNDETRGSSGLRLGRISKALVIAEIALSCGLLVAAGLMIKTVVNVAQFDRGFTTENIFTSRLGLFVLDYPTPESQWQFYDALLRRLDVQPGVQGAAFTSDLPTRGGQMWRLTVDGETYASEDDHPPARRIVITGNYFDLFDVSLVRGRTFSSTDTADNLQVAIVNERFVELFYPDEDPIGQRVKLGDDDEPWRTIVGIVPDMHLGGAIGATNPRHEGVYIPLQQNVINFMSLIARTEQNPLGYTAAIQSEVNAIDIDLPLYWVRSLEEQYALDTWAFRTFGTLFMAFGFAALALATIGLYGVMSFSASNRTREIGVRMALGAGTDSVLMLILRQGAIQLAIGLTIGLGVALALSQGLTALLFDVEPWDPTIFVVVMISLGLSGLLASFVPAKRATRVDPMVALRYE